MIFKSDYIVISHIQRIIAAPNTHHICIEMQKSSFEQYYYIKQLAVSTRPPAGDLSRCALYCLGPASLCQD